MQFCTCRLFPFLSIGHPCEIKHSYTDAKRLKSDQRKAPMTAWWFLALSILNLKTEKHYNYYQK